MAQKTLNVQLGIGATMSRALMAGGIGLLIAGVVMLISKMRSLNEQRKEDRPNSNSTLSSQHNKEVSSAQNLERVLRNSSNSYDKRLKALDKLKERCPIIMHRFTLRKES